MASEVEVGALQKGSEGLETAFVDEGLGEGAPRKMRDVMEIEKSEELDLDPSLQVNLRCTKSLLFETTAPEGGPWGRLQEGP